VVLVVVLYVVLELRVVMLVLFEILRVVLLGVCLRLGNERGECWENGSQPPSRLLCRLNTKEEIVVFLVVKFF